MTVKTASLTRFWDTLLGHIEEGNVIPILGPELSTVTYQGRSLTVEQLLAELLREQFGLEEDLPGADVELSQICAFLNRQREGQAVYAALPVLLRKLALKPGAALRSLAGIANFDLYLTLAWDGLLPEALLAERGQVAPSLSFAPNEFQDLPPEYAHAPRGGSRIPLAYGLLGALSYSPNYAVSDEDRLEHLTALVARRPKALMDRLSNSHLLFIGTNLSDWLARFLLRATKNCALSKERQRGEFLVDSKVSGNPNLVTFLDGFSRETKVFARDPAEFVAELHQRWAERNPSGIPAQVPSRGSVFISYAWEDQPAVRRIAESLQAAGVEVWVDLERLDLGDGYDPKIRGQIRACSYFMPVISRAALARREGYFRGEWRMAVERSHNISLDTPFFLPVVLDSTEKYAENQGIPEEIRGKIWATAPDGELPASCLQHMSGLIRSYWKREQGLAV